MKTLVKIALWMLAAGVVFAAVYFFTRTAEQPQEEPLAATPGVLSLFNETPLPDRPLVICKYTVQAVEEAPRQVKFGNFK